MSEVRIAYAGDRDISVEVLRFILDQGVKPLALMTSATRGATHAQDLRDLCGHLSDEEVLKGSAFREPSGVEFLASLNLDYLIGIHFPYIFPTEVLDLPRVGVLNLHPAFLPYNRGWHTPSWAILEGTPYGGTLHFMTEDLDAGDIVHQKKIDVSPGDTADSLYRRVKDVEQEVFREAWPELLDGEPPRTAQSLDEGTFHKRDDLHRPEVQEIDLEGKARAGDLIDRLRALTTNDPREAAYFRHGGRTYRLRLTIESENGS